VSIFINVLSTAFTLLDPKSVKKIDNLTVFFMLLGSESIKAVQRTLMKLSPGVFHQSFWAASARTDTKSANRHWWRDCLFVLLGSAFVKVGEIDPKC